MVQAGRLMGHAGRHAHHSSQQRPSTVDGAGSIAFALQCKPFYCQYVAFEWHVVLQVPVAIPEDQLPLTLPPTQDFAPSGRAESPLAKITDWVQTTDPSTGTYMGSVLYAVQSFQLPSTRFDFAKYSAQLKPAGQWWALQSATAKCRKNE